MWLFFYPVKFQLVVCLLPHAVAQGMITRFQAISNWVLEAYWNVPQCIMSETKWCKNSPGLERSHDPTDSKVAQIWFQWGMFWSLAWNFKKKKTMLRRNQSSLSSDRNSPQKSASLDLFLSLLSEDWSSHSDFTWENMLLPGHLTIATTDRVSQNVLSRRSSLSLQILTWKLLLFPDILRINSWGKEEPVYWVSGGRKDLL